MRNVIFASQAEKDFQSWATKDKKTLKKILSLISDIDRNPFSGLGKPEPLKHELATFWSRRINNKDRLVYRISADNEIIIISFAKWIQAM